MKSAKELDRADPLREFRSRFVVADPDLIYLDGNSLGRMPKAASERAKEVIDEQWGEGLVRSWAEWFELPEKIGAKIAKLIGAQPDEVIVADSTTVNLFKLVMAAMWARKGRTEVVTDDLNFPSDFYAIMGALEVLGPEYRLRTAHTQDQITVPNADIAKLLNEKTALLTTSHVSFKSAFMHDMKSVTAAAHDVGALVLWDLSHAVGAVPVDLNGCKADLAIGCTYKYLNGGPGSPAFLYVRRDLQQELQSPIWGWFSQTNPFAFDLIYSAVPKVRKFLVGTPPVVSLALIEPGVDMVIEAGMDRLREKSVAQTEFLIELWEEHLRPLGVTLKSPRDSAARGSHVSFGHPKALQIDQALIEEMKVVPDFRTPDNIRFGCTPLYTTFEELEEAVLRFKRVVESGIYEKYANRVPAVT